MNKQKLIDAYKNKNVYITGITGFKGGWLALMLHELGANVYGIGLRPENKDNIFYSASIDSIARVTFGNIVDNANTSKLIPSITEANPDYIFHMAAQPIVSDGYKEPFNTFHTNIMGTVIMHEVLRGLRVPANKDDLLNGNSVRNKESVSTCKRISFINVTTDKVYKEKDKPLKETDEMFGFDPYSLSKTCSDMISTCYREAMESQNYISTMRAGNVIGGGDFSHNRIIPDIIKSSIKNETLKVRNPHSVRPYQHVFDALTAYLLLGILQKENPSLQSEYNVGPDLDQTMTTEELLRKFSSNLDFNWEHTEESIGKESDYLALDNSKIKDVGWISVYNNNNKVVNATSLWYNEFMNGENMQKFTLNQIREAFDEYGK